MQSRQVIGLVAVIAIICLALGAAIGITISSEKNTASITTQTQTVTSYEIPNHLTTLTRLVLVSYVTHYDTYICGTETYGGGTIYIESTNTTEYLFQAANNNTGARFLNVTITTTTSSQSENAVTTVTLTASTSDNSTICPTIV